MREIATLVTLAFVMHAANAAEFQQRDFSILPAVSQVANQAQTAGQSPGASYAASVIDYCATPGVLDESCFRNALAHRTAGQASTIQVPAGTFLISALNITTPNVTFNCLPGAILQPTRASSGIRITANNVSFVGCTLDMQNIEGAPGISANKVSGFSFNNGSMVNIKNQSALKLTQTSNDIIDHNHLLSQGIADAVDAYGPTTNIQISNNFGIGSSEVISGRNANGTSSGVSFIANSLQPPVNNTIFTTGDFSDGYGAASPITNIVITGNTCNIIAATPSVAPFGCFSLVAGYDLTFSNNVMNAKGQYVRDSLLELGTSRSTVTGNVFNEGDDPGSQNYDGIVMYSGNISLSQNTFHGASSYGNPIRIYPQSNADGISISGGSIDVGDSFGAQIASQTPGTGYSGAGTCTVNGGTYSAQARCTATVTKSGGVVFAITSAGRYTVAPTTITTSLSTHGTPATVRVGQALNHAIAVACNQGRIPLRINGIQGPGPRGPVTSASVSLSPGSNAPVGAGFTIASGTPVTGGSGTGLKLDILAVDEKGGIASIGITKGGEGSGYKIGDFVYYPVTGSQIAAEAKGLVVGGGLTISGAVFHAVDIQGVHGANCPVSASMSNVSISGPQNSSAIVTGVYHKNAELKLSGTQFRNVTRNTDGDH